MTETLESRRRDAKAVLDIADRSHLLQSDARASAVRLGEDNARSAAKPPRWSPRLLRLRPAF